MKSLHELTDHDLIRLFNAGDARGIEYLALKYKTKLYSSILYLVKHKYLADDIMQDVFIKIIYSLKSGCYQEEGKFSAWAMRVSRNLCMDSIRSMHRICSIGTIVNNYICTGADSVEENPETRMIEMQTGSIVEELLKYLPADQQKVIVLRLYNNLSYNEIALLLNCNINTAKGRMHHGIKKLRRMIMQKHLYHHLRDKSFAG